MDTKNDRQPATSATEAQRTAQASDLTADANEVRGYGGLAGGVVASGFSGPVFGIGAVGAARDDVQIQGSAVHPIVQPFASKPTNSGD
jgi:hypothetical protein